MTQAKKKRPRLSPNARLYKKVYDEEFAGLTETYRCRL